MFPSLIQRLYTPHYYENLLYALALSTNLVGMAHIDLARLATQHPIQLQCIEN